MILELQPQYHELGDMFGVVAVQYMLDRGYTHLANLYAANIGGVKMETLAAFLEQSGYGVLLYGGHGDGNVNTGGESFSLYSAAQAERDSLIAWQYFTADELTIMQNPEHTYWMIAFTQQYTDNKPAGCSIALIAGCYGIFSGDFNASCKLGGGISATNGALQRSFDCLLTQLVQPMYRTIDLAADHCTHTMSDPEFAYGVPSCDWQLFSFDDPGADVLGFTVVNGEASWFLESLYRTESLALEGRNTKSDDWQPIAIPIPMCVGKTTVDVANIGYRLFRLVETESSVRKLIHGEVRAQWVDPSDLMTRKKNKPTLAQAKARFEEVRDKSLASGYGSIPRATTSGTKLLIYTNNDMFTAVTISIAQFWTDKGYQVSVELVDGFPSNPDQFRATLDAAIASEAASGTEYFLLVGDANDWVEFSQPWPGEWEDIRQALISSGYPPGGQPEKDIIPTWIIPDPVPRDQGMSYFNPYWFTDQPYADIDGDDIPDVVVSRLPFTTPAEVYAYATKLYSENPSWEVDKVAFLIGNRNRSDSDGTRARLAAWNVIEPYRMGSTWTACTGPIAGTTTNGILYRRI